MLSRILPTTLGLLLFLTVLGVFSLWASPNLKTPALAQTQEAYAADPAYALSCKDIPGCQAILDKLNAIAAFSASIWQAASCVVDVNCWLKNLIVAGLNQYYYFMIGVQFSDLTGTALVAMLQGNWHDGLAFGTAEAIDSYYQQNPVPLHFASYLKAELSDNILNRPVFAQSRGQDLLGLFGVPAMWRQMRDAAYALFALLALFIGLMIMFGKEAAPRMTVTFAYALPRLVVGVILVTFSFAIIALGFDLIAVAGSEFALKVAAPQEALIQFEKGGGGAIGQVLGPRASAYVATLLAIVLSSFDLAKAGAFEVIEAAMMAGMFLMVGTLALLLVGLQLVLRTARILLTTIFSPLVLLVGTLPGQEGITENLVRSLLADFLAFPAIAFVLAITANLYGQFLNVTVEPSVGGFLSTFLPKSILVLVFTSIIFILAAFKAPGIIQNMLLPPQRVRR